MADMAEINEIRRQEAERHRARLWEFIRLHCEGRQKNFITLTGINQGELSGLLKDKSFGGPKARSLEHKAKMLPGALSEPDGAPFYADAYHKPTESGRSNKRVEVAFSEVQKDVRGGKVFETKRLPQPSEEEFSLVPELDIAAACVNGRFQDHVVVEGGMAFKKSFLAEHGVPEGAARIIYASGGSMSPRIQDGRAVLLNLAEREPVDSKIFAICLPEGGIILKRLVRDYHPAAGAVVWLLRSENPDRGQFPDKILPPDDHSMIIGRAVWTDSVL